MRIEMPAPEMEPQLKKLWKLCFGDEDAFVEGFLEGVCPPERRRCVTEEGKVLAALYWMDVCYDGQPFAYLYAVSTHPERRGRGLCRALMADTHAHLEALGYAGCLLYPAEPGLRRMYAGMGYEDCCRGGGAACVAGKTLPLRPVAVEEYARLRRLYLPKGGVTQEGENLACLSLFAKLYAGENFLLAAQREGDFLHGIELLGDQTAGPGILAVLGCERGFFYTPGNARETAMLLPLRENLRKPVYFGLTFA